MIWLGLATITVCVWLFIPKLAYMKIVLVLALVIGAAVAWADVDTVVARYNVNAYLSGTQETVDIYYLESLGSGAIPYIQKLSYAQDPQVASSAMSYMSKRNHEEVKDFRDWNFADHQADSLLLRHP